MSLCELRLVCANYLHPALSGVWFRMAFPADESWIWLLPHPLVMLLWDMDTRAGMAQANITRRTFGV